MNQLNVGILAHVDAGKTTLSEALLYTAGQIRKLGRVDHGDAFLDTDALERERGITILSKEARLEHRGVAITLVDTPGHMDFSTEAERALSVLDCAVLVVSGTDGVQSHTATLWRLLARYRVPVFVFFNKMDLPGKDRQALLDGLGAGCVDFTLPRSELDEQAALCDEAMLERYLESGSLDDSALGALIAGRRLFPCFFGSALKSEGVDALLSGLCTYGPVPGYGPDLGARVYKILRDEQGARLTFLKVTGGTLRVKQALAGEDGRPEKIDQIRLYSGARYRMAEEAPAGTLCAVTGLSGTRPGQGLGAQADADGPALAPVLRYQVLLPQGCDPHTALNHLRQLEEEDPMLHVTWREHSREIDVRLMGEVQREILARRLQDRFGLAVSFGPGSILYAETLESPVVGVGHFEPLRHYAEVHLLLEPLPLGSGLAFGSACSTDVLPGNWQNLVLTHLAERPHPGVLTGAPITDMRITLLTGRGHVQYTAGGDFRQATYRAVRQGLMEARSILLEPWYDIQLELPADQVGRAMSDLRRMHGACGDPDLSGELAALRGSVPVAQLGDYAREVTAYTRGRGRLSLSVRGYLPCHDQAAVVQAHGYDPQRDVDNPADSVFCAKGTGYTVKWQEAKAAMHIPVVSPSPRLGRREAETTEPDPEPPPAPAVKVYTDTRQQDRELQAIFERTYGPIRHRDILPLREVSGGAYTPAAQTHQAQCLLVDGYNMIHAWPMLKQLAEDSVDTARQRLCHLLSGYQAVRGGTVIAVFDAYKVPRPEVSVERHHNIFVVYTKEAETADAYIEKTTFQLGRRYRVRVATSDSAEQLIILGHGASRMGAQLFYEEVLAAHRQIEALLQQNEGRRRPLKLGEALERPDLA